MAIFNERVRTLSEWITALPSMRRAFNTAVRYPCGISLNDVKLGRRAGTSFTALVEKEELELAELDVEKLREDGQGIIDDQGQLHREAFTRRERRSRGEIPYPTVADFVIVAGVMVTKKHTKLVSERTGP